MKNIADRHWQILALLEAMGEPVGAEQLSALASMDGASLQEFLRAGLDSGMVTIHADGGISLAPDLPVEILRRLGTINTKERVSLMARKVMELGLQETIPARATVSLLARAGRDLDAVSIAREKVRDWVRAGANREALKLLETAMTLSVPHIQTPDCDWDPIFVDVATELCRLRTKLARDIHAIPAVIDQVMAVARRLGDLRTMARLELVRGLYRYMTGDTAGGLALIASGLCQAESLGDDDIMAVSAEFKGIYYYLQGMYKEAVDSFEIVVRLGDSIPTFLPEYLASSSALGYCSALLGQYHRAVGVLDAHWRRSRMQGNDETSCFIEALLGIVLIIMGRRSDAYEHLCAARRDAEERGNTRALHVAQKGLAYHSYFEGDLDKAYRITKDTVYAEAIGPQYNWPVTLEMLYAFKLEGYPDIDSLAFEEEMERVLASPNVHLRGVALRLRALQARARNEDPDVVLSYLDASESDLLASGDIIELAKTRAEKARLKLAVKDQTAARNLALMAWEGLGGYGRDLFPSDLVPMLQEGGSHRPHAGKDLIDRFMDIMDEFVPSADRDELLSRLVYGASRFFGAERCGLFWFTGPSGRPGLRASFNLQRSDVFSLGFRASLGHVFKVLRSGQPLVARAGFPETSDPDRGPRVVVCLPVSVFETLSGVLYMDYWYTDPADAVLERDVLVRSARHIGSSVERILHYTDMVSARAPGGPPPSENGGHSWSSTDILGNSASMAEIISRVDQVASTDANVLVSGETGTGKELLARRIHEAGRRREGPFVVVDLAAVPETLVESELFGHEKGAFTGAERQKKGKVELAHMGTLFIDEIGDVPSSAQVKLLRVLQEKSFVRLGGTRTIRSDFRLVAATNRDLAGDVADGCFRKDLYYRLNVVPLRLPPLRERGRDVVILAQEFLARYAKKYHRQLPPLSEDDIAALMAYPWPGNVRELKNVMERAAILSTPRKLMLGLDSIVASAANMLFDQPLTMDELQRRYIRHVLGLTRGRIGGPGGAARILGMKRSTLQARMKKLGIV